MGIRLGTLDDFGTFIGLARPVEDLFGPMVEEAGFHAAVTRNLRRGSALVAETDSGAAVGGLLFSFGGAPTHRISWLVVADQFRSEGHGQALVAEAVRRWVEPPAVIEVITFGPDHPGARSRGFYERLGFHPGKMAADGPEGGGRQLYRLSVEHKPDWATD